MAQPLSINKYFRKLKDPRIKRHRKHLLIDIIAITICAAICNCNDWQQIATFARCRHDWLKKFLRLPNGIPSHDTLERVFDRLDPAAFQACFREWMHALHTALLPIIAVADGGANGDRDDVDEEVFLVPLDAWVFEFAEILVDRQLGASHDIPP